MDSWPTSLPQSFNQQGFSITEQDANIRTEMAAGPQFVRRRFTAKTTRFMGSMIIDSTQYTTLMTFYNSTLHGGVDEFTWKHPITEASATVRFMGDPTVTPAGGNWYQAALSLEIMP